MVGTSPVGPDAHVDVPLSNFASMAFSASVEDFIADQVLPEIPVGKQSDKYYIIERGEFQRRLNTLRAPRTKAERVNFTVSSDSFFADNYALAGENAMEEINNADNPIRLRENTVLLVQHGLRLDQEFRTANLLTSISNVGSGATLAGAAKWSDANSDPVGDVSTGHAFIRSRTGLVANIGIIDWDTIQIVRRHPALLDMFKFTSGGELTNDQLREVFKLDRILVGKAVVENALEGGTSSMTNVWGNNMVLAHIGPATGLQSQTLAGRFRWRNPIFPADFAVLTSVENQAGQRHVEIVETGYFQDEKVIASELGYVIASTL